jgi:death-on-curing protein
VRYFSVREVIAIHEKVILPNELQGVAQYKSIEAVIGRVENRLAYGLMGDVFDLAACYACYIAVGHCFNDANRRTAHTSMHLVLQLNSIFIEYEVEELGDKMIGVAQGLEDEDELASYLRLLPRREEL